MESVDNIFASIRDGILPSASFPPRNNPDSRSLSHLHDLDGPSAASAIDLADELMNTKRYVLISVQIHLELNHKQISREYITAMPERKTRMLLQGLLQYWGLYFSFSATTSQGQASIPSTSPDLAFAIKLLRRSQTSRAAAGVDLAHSAEKLFYALYLSRILVLSQFLDSLPPDLSERQARKEWLYFQLVPPSTSAGVDIFTTVLKGVVGGDVEHLKMSAERKLSALGWRNHQWFSQSLIASYVEDGCYIDPVDQPLPPFYLAVDEIEMPASEVFTPRSAHRIARRRAEVYALLCGAHPSDSV